MNDLDIERDSHKAYSDSIIDWGRSGSFSPCVQPDEASLERLYQVQTDLAEKHPEIELTRELFFAFF